jgi:DNA mismatch repair protein MutS
MENGRGWVASLQERERSRTGIASLKVGFNRVFGYYLEVTRPHLALVPPEWERRQTLVGAERFITRDLKEEEERILGAEERAVRLERELFQSLRSACAAHAPGLVAVAAAIARLDVLAAFAHAARDRRWSRPVITAEPRLVISGGRHPVVESRLPPGEFVPNDVSMDTASEQILLVTGPNMAGKSTYLRQVAHLVILAQAGSFVPAGSAEIGLVSSIASSPGWARGTISPAARARFSSRCRRSP